MHLDFTSALYLGFRHSSAEIETWRHLTLGVPAAVRTWPQAAGIESKLRRLCSAEAALLGRSSLHLFSDLFGLFERSQWSVIADQRCYPISGWAVCRMLGSGGKLLRFSHHDTADLARQCLFTIRRGLRPLILTDSFCCVCGKAPDIAAYCRLAKQYDGLVVMDDTQGIGLFGENASQHPPYGRGGGGSLRAHRLEREPIVVVNSLAKAFGSPVAVAAGPDRFLSRLRRFGDSRVHCSQPSAADIASVTHALRLNEREGDKRRQCLADAVEAFQSEAARFTLPVVDSIHPTQSICVSATAAALQCQEGLRSVGISCLIGRGHRKDCRLIFLLAAGHHPEEVRYTVRIVRKLLAHACSSPRPSGRAHLRFPNSPTTMP